MWFFSLECWITSSRCSSWLLATNNHENKNPVFSMSITRFEKTKSVILPLRLWKSVSRVIGQNNQFLEPDRPLINNKNHDLFGFRCKFRHSNINTGDWKRTESCHCCKRSTSGWALLRPINPIDKQVNVTVSLRIISILIRRDCLN